MRKYGVATSYWADWFWQRVGARPDFPVAIGYAAMCALEVHVEEVDNLTTITAASNLEGIRIHTPGSIDERRIHGCLAVNRHGATILVEKSDDEAQKRFTIAHECAHFILAVRAHQEHAACRLGYDVSDVLHGRQEATPTARIDAHLSNVHLKPLAHVMDRTATGRYSCARVHQAECLADDLAAEILAPRAELRAAIASLGRLSFAASLSAAQRIAARQFGLPQAMATWHAQRVVWEWQGGPSAAEKFGFGSES